MKKIAIFFAVLSFLWVNCFGNDLQAQSVISANNQTTIDQARNGVPVVYIAHPNRWGLSHNIYGRFDVSQLGLILNNSLQVGRSQLGGIITNNPNFTNRTASLILNEVVGTNPSLLRGYMEVFGAPADMILANPNGIFVNGGGFINIPRATLTTGTPTFDSSGALRGLSVNRGEVLIEGKGVNVNNVNTFDIVTRTAKLNAEIHGKNVGVFAGRQTFNYATRAAQAKAEDGKPKPEIAIDGQALGAMVANRITLVGTETGVGVRLDPTMAMSAEDIVINSQGQVVLKNTLEAGQINVASQDDMNLEGKMTVRGTATLTSNNKINADNTLIANKVDATSQGDMLFKGTLGAQDTVKLTSQGKVNLDNKLVANKVDITAQDDMSLKGEMQVQDTAKLMSNRKVNVNNTLTANKVDITAQDDMALKGTMVAQDAVQLTSVKGKVALDNNLKAKKIDITTQEKDLFLAGRMEIEDTATLTSQGKVDLNNILKAGNVHITSQDDMALKGKMAIRDTAKLVSNRKININNILTADKINITSQKDMSLAGTMLAKDMATLKAVDGQITLKNKLEAKTIDITSQGKDLWLGGRLIAQDTAMLKAPKGRLTFAKNTGTIGRKRLIAEANWIDVQEESEVAAALDENGDPVPGHLTMTAYQKLHNQDGVLWSGDKLTLNAHKLHNDEGEIWSEGDMVLQGPGGLPAHEIINDSGGINADKGSLFIKTNLLHNRRKGFPIVARISEAKAKETLLASLISSGRDMTIQAKEIKNYFSDIAAGGNITLHGKGLNQKAASIYKITEKTIPGRWVERPHTVRSYEGKDSYAYSEHTEMRRVYIESEVVKTPVDVGEARASIQAKGDIFGDFVDRIDNKTLARFRKKLPDEKKENPLAKALGFAAIVPQAVPDKINNNPAPGRNYNDIIPLLMDRKALFKRMPFGHPYKIETRLRFVNLENFYGSDYFLSRIGGFDPDDLPRRLGDAFFETRLMRQQILEQTGKRWLDPNITNDRLQMKQLLDQGIQAKKDFNLSLGIALTANQINSLTRDIVWYVKQKVEGETVLVPRLYLAKATRDAIDPNGAVIMAKNVDIKSGSIRNTRGTIKAEENLTLAAKDDIINKDGILKSQGDANFVTVEGDIIHTSSDQAKGLIDVGGDLSTESGRDTKVTGAKVKVKGNASIKAKRDVVIQARKKQETAKDSLNDYVFTEHEAATVETEGELNIDADRDVTILGSNVAAKEDASLAAGRNLNLGITADQTTITRARDNFVYDRVTHTGSQVKTGGNLNMEAGNNLNVIGSQAIADEDLNAKAGGSLNILDAHDSFHFQVTTKTKKSFGRSRTTSSAFSSSTSKGSFLSSGKDMTLEAKDNIAIRGSWAGADGDITAKAGQAFNMVSGTDSWSSSSYSRKKGFLSSSRNSSWQQGQTQKSSAMVSNQNIFTDAGQNARIAGSAMVAGGNITITAGRDVILDTTQNISRARTQHESSKPFLRGFWAGDGVGVALGISKSKGRSETLQITNVPSQVTSGGTTTIISGRDIKTKATQFASGLSTILKPGRDIVLGAANDLYSYWESNKTTELGVSVGLNQNISRSVEVINQSVQGAFSGEGSALYEAITIASSALNATKAFTDLVTGSVVEFGTGLYGRKTKSETVVTSTTSQPTTIDAGQDVIVKANTGSITAEGTQINAGNDVNLDAEKNLNILATKDTFSLSQKEDKKEVGILASAGVGPLGPQAIVNMSAEYEQKKKKEGGVTHQNAQINAANKVTTKSGEDTNLKGVVIKGKTVETIVGGNFTVASVQNIHYLDYIKKSLTLGAGFGSGGDSLFDIKGAAGNLFSAIKDINLNIGFLGFNYERDKRNRVFTDNQSKIVGQEEVKINVAGRTHVKGAVITSSGGDVDLKTNSFSHENLKDEDKHSKTKVSGFVLDDPLNPGPRRSLKDVLPAVDVQHEKAETEGITRATIAAPNGEEIITITVAPEASLEGLNRTLEKAQEIVREEKKSVRIVIAAPLFAPLETVEEVGDALENLVKGFEKLSQHLVGSPLQKLPEQMKSQIAYLESLGYDREAIYNVLSNPTYQKVITGIMSTINEGEVKGYFSKEDGSSGKYLDINLGPTVGEEILLEAAKMKDFIGDLPAEEAAITIAGMQMALGPVKFVSSVTIQTIGQIFGREYIEDTKDTIAERLMFIAGGDWRHGKQYRKEIEATVGLFRDANPDSEVGERFAGARFIVEVMAGGIVLRKGGLAKRPKQEPSLGKRNQNDPKVNRPNNMTSKRLWSETDRLTSVRNALKHWNKHKSDFPKIRNASEYTRAAKKFLNNPPKGTLSKPSPKGNGDILRYNPSTNTFGVVTKDGTPRTMFKPKEGIKYWNKQ